MPKCLIFPNLASCCDKIFSRSCCYNGETQTEAFMKIELPSVKRAKF